MGVSSAGTGKRAPMPSESFDALITGHDDDGAGPSVQTLSVDDLPEGDVLVEVAYSDVNYKDALAARPDGQVARISPLVPGIDLAGTVVEGADKGALVLAHGYEIGVARYGGGPPPPPAPPGGGRAPPHERAPPPARGR